MVPCSFDSSLTQVKSPKHRSRRRACPYATVRSRRARATNRPHETTLQILSGALVENRLGHTDGVVRQKWARRSRTLSLGVARTRRVFVSDRGGLQREDVVGRAAELLGLWSMTLRAWISTSTAWICVSPAPGWLSRVRSSRSLIPSRAAGQIVPCIAVAIRRSQSWRGSSVLILIDGYRRIAALRRLGRDTARVECCTCDLAAACSA
jgi:hypothetical protein